MAEKPRFQIIRSKGITIWDNQLGETLHSTMGAWEEATRIYIAQSEITELFNKSSGEPCFLFDIGFGIGANSLSALEFFKKRLAICPPLRIISVENDLGALLFALENLNDFPFLERNQSIVRSLIEKSEWQDESGKIHWKLIRDDFRKLTFRTAEYPPERVMIYYDFFSPKLQPELWTRECFEKLPLGRLITYTASTAVRVAMLQAGFFVSAGEGTHLKRETTIASGQMEGFESLLGLSWLEKLEPSLKTELLNHPQFKDRVNHAGG